MDKQIKSHLGIINRTLKASYIAKEERKWQKKLGYTVDNENQDVTDTTSEQIVRANELESPSDQSLQKQMTKADQKKQHAWAQFKFAPTENLKKLEK